MKTKDALMKKVERKEPILGEALPVYRDIVLLEDSDERSEVPYLPTYFLSTVSVPFFCSSWSLSGGSEMVGTR